MNSRAKPCKSQTKAHIWRPKSLVRNRGISLRAAFSASQMNPLGRWKTWEAISSTSAFSRFFPIGKRSIQLLFQIVSLRRATIPIAKQPPAAPRAQYSRPHTIASSTQGIAPRILSSSPRISAMTATTRPARTASRGVSSLPTPSSKNGFR